MIRRTLFVLALVIVAPLQFHQTARAQTTIGTTLGAPTTIEGHLFDGSWLGQTFVAGGNYMTGLSIWFYGGTSSI